MAENDIIFNVGLEVDTSEVKRQLKNLRVPQIKIPTAADFIKSDTELRSFTRGAHKAWVEKESRKLASVVIGSGLTPTQALTATHPLVGLSKSQRIIRGQLGARVSELVTDVKTQQRQAEREQKAQERAEFVAQRQADLVQQIESAKDIKNLPPLTKKQILSEAVNIQKTPQNQRTIEQNAILNTANQIVKTNKDSTDSQNKLLGSITKLGAIIGAASAVIQGVKAVIEISTHNTKEAIRKAYNPNYSVGINKWLTTGDFISEDQAIALQQDLATFRMKTLRGQVSGDVRQTLGLFAPDAYRALLDTGAPTEQRIIRIMRSMQGLNAEQLGQLQSVPELKNLMPLLAMPYEDLIANYPSAMAAGQRIDEQTARSVYNSSWWGRRKNEITQFMEKNINLTAGAKAGGAVLGAASLLIPGVNVAAGTAAGMVGGGIVGATTDPAVKPLGDYKLDMPTGNDGSYMNPVPVQDITQRPIENNITIPVYIDSELTETRHLTTRAEMGGI